MPGTDWFRPARSPLRSGLRPVNDPLIARFANACGATAPLDLRVDLAGGGVLAEGSIDQPFTLVGRDDACDVTLADPDINPRHVWLQALGGRVFAVDLGSRTGLTWPDGGHGPGWLDPGTPVRIGSFLLRLRAPATDRPSTYPTSYNPLASDTGAKARPAVALEFRNGRRAKDRWQVNRLLTLVGRAADCKIHLTADDISPYHCGLVSTPSGLWVVDLSGHGVVVNGERMRFAPLPQGAELWVGRFLIGCQYQVPPPAVGKSGRLSSPRPGANGAVPTPRPPVAVPVPPPAPPAPEDEVELGAAPDSGGLPGSHIMADAFRLWGPTPSGQMSSPILVSGSGPKSSAAPSPGAAMSADESSVLGASDDWSVAPLLRQLAERHGRSGTEFQQSLALVSRAFGRAKREHLAILQQELARIFELTAEIGALQLEVAQRALEAAAGDRARSAPAPDGAKPADPRSGAWVPPSTKTPLPDTPTPPPRPDPSASAPAARAADRLSELQQARAASWYTLAALFAGT